MIFQVSHQTGTASQCVVIEDVEERVLPKHSQSARYGTIFKSIFGVKELTLVYVDMDVFEKYPVPLVDKTDWLKEQIQILHRAIRDSKSPNEEQSFECKFCPYNSKCSGLKQTVGYSQQIMLKNKLEYKSRNVKN